MCWKKLRRRARQLGFDLAGRACHGDGGRDWVTRESAPAGQDWIFVGNYEHAVNIWVRPRTEAARCLMQSHVAAIIADCDSFVEPLADYDDEYFAAAAPWRAAGLNPECGRMPA